MVRRRTKNKRSNTQNQDDESTLFQLPSRIVPEPRIKSLQFPIWTEKKAQLIERYLYYFVLVTKHGTYIDGFAGPQQPDKPEMWAAKLVIDNEPKRLNHFYLFDSDRTALFHLKKLKEAHPDRDIVVYGGDFNEKIVRLLNSERIKQTEATFCLLDQRTFECHWSSVKALAGYKSSSFKIELFYFLPNFWLERAVSGLRNFDMPQKWWGKTDWPRLFEMNRNERKDTFVQRFKNELGYASVKPWPIYEKQGGGRIMYYMIHATDHPEAPKLMERAYNKAVQPKEPLNQLQFELGLNKSSQP
jgi:three-Cys-motif partner protein